MRNLNSFFARIPSYVNAELLEIQESRLFHQARKGLEEPLAKVKEVDDLNIWNATDWLFHGPDVIYDMYGGIVLGEMSTLKSHLKFREEYLAERRRRNQGPQALGELASLDLDLRQLNQNPGSLCSDVEAFSRERWNHWKQRLEEIAKGTEEYTPSERLIERIRQTVEKMDKAEKKHLRMRSQKLDFTREKENLERLVEGLTEPDDKE